jgi:exopolyphosphatase / guanosine-5'-triphosphate,3'-diphosphate pyrophosphatase
VTELVEPSDLQAITQQLGREPRGVAAIAHRCPCGNPDVVATNPRLPNGTPFPTTFYLTCPTAASRIGTLEGSGLMREMEARLQSEPALAASYAAAHQAYLDYRRTLGEVPEIEGISAGGMPHRVKCLHVLAAHALAVGPGVNLFGDEVVERLGQWWVDGSCAPTEARERVAAIDCGTNSIKILIAEGDQAVLRESHMIRLGQGLEVTGELSSEALARAGSALDRFAHLLAEHSVSRVRLVATSATREARNAAEFTDLVQTKLGIRPEVLTGAEEAELSFAGAMVFATRRESELGKLAFPTLVVDIGGGSTELIVGEKQPQVAASLNIGAVRLHERHLLADPPTREQVAACVADIDAELAASGIPFAEVRSVVGVAGTILTIAGGLGGVTDYLTLREGPVDVSVAGVKTAAADLLGMTVAQRRVLPYMNPGRADVIGAGALILVRILKRTSVSSMVVSGTGILDGLAWSMR